jgi:prepilin-type N-terminal cleavage/methylation domain-containing protein
MVNALRARRAGGSTGRGFTLIELLVVLAVLALLLTIAAPRYVRHVERAREATLRSSLKVMRESIDKFYGDRGRWPASLEELVALEYLKGVPVDPITEKNDTWIVLSEAEMASAQQVRSSGGTAAPADRNAKVAPGVADVHSGAEGNGEDGRPYQEW